MIKVFLTGGNGFIGKNIIEGLSHKYNFIAPRSFDLDLTNEIDVFNFLKLENPDIIIHTANIGGKRNKIETDNIVQDNLRMFFNLVRCSHLYEKMIYFGSGAEFDKSMPIIDADEDYFDSCVPNDDYGFSKYVMTKYTLTADNIFNLRLFGVFGKYEDWGIRLISNACCKAIYDLPITIKRDVIFDYLYVDDLVKIIDWFIDNTPLKKVFNVCSGKKYLLSELAEIVREVSGKDLEIKIDQTGLANEYSANNNKIKAIIPDVAFIEIKTAIKELYDWYDGNRHLIEKEKLLFDK